MSEKDLIRANFADKVVFMALLFAGCFVVALAVAGQL